MLLSLDAKIDPVNVYIETDRLIIRPLQLTDVDGMFVMDGDPEVHKYVGRNHAASKERIVDAITSIRQQYVDNKIGRWAVIEKDTNEFVGWTGFKLMKEKINGHEEFLDFGYRFAHKFWGRGYATESGRAALHYGIDKLGFKDISAMTNVDNAASRRVLEKLGFRLVTIFGYDGAINWQEAGQPTTWYEYQGRL